MLKGGYGKIRDLKRDDKTIAFFFSVSTEPLLTFENGKAKKSRLGKPLEELRDQLSSTNVLRHP